jgi:hypothetical protein
MVNDVLISFQTALMTYFGTNGALIDWFEQTSFVTVHAFI